MYLVLLTVICLIRSLMWLECDALSIESSSLAEGVSRIIGGQVTGENDIPYQVSLQVRSSTADLVRRHVCGGSLLTGHHVITAAHCVVNIVQGDDESKDTWTVKDPREYVVFGGSATLQTSAADVARRFRYPSSFDPHQNFSANTFNNDVAIIKLTTSFPITTATAVIVLSTQLPPDDQSCVVSGWGSTIKSQTVWDVQTQLRAASVHVIARSACARAYSSLRTPNITDDMLCAGATDGSTDACFGDSGGPLVCRGVLVGVVSWGIVCGSATYPGVYASVPHLYSWINDTINSGPQTCTMPYELVIFGLFLCYLNVVMLYKQ